MPSTPTKKPDYYAKGSTELAQETPLTINRLEPRRKLTMNSVRLVIVLVGLPARGKSFVARKMQHFMQWYGVDCRIFNVGRYRRQAHAAATASSGQCDANFFDSKNTEAAALREKVAELALNDMLGWLDGEDGTHGGSTASPSSSDSESDESKDETKGENGKNGLHKDDGSTKSLASMSSTQKRHRAHLECFHDKIAIFDATNSTKKRRDWLLHQCTSPEKRQGKPTGMVFVESICDDKELLQENFKFKVSNSPDYAGMTQEDAISDLQQRVKKYEEQYETIKEDSLSYIKIFNLSTKLLVNHIYGRMAKLIVPALMAWNIGTRPVFLCRPGQTIHDVTTDGEDYVSRVEVVNPKIMAMSDRVRRRVLRGDSLGRMGKQFREDLFTFVFEEAVDFMMRRESTMDMAPTGTSITGLAPGPWEKQKDTAAVVSGMANDNNIPIKIYTSTMPRALETIQWKDTDEFQTEEKSSLNPLDKGDFAGKELEEVKDLDPEWYAQLEQDPFYTRFPGGESYRDLIQRLESMIVEIEQQVTPTLVVSHVSVLQMLIAYFRNSPVDKAMSIEVPLHTVIKFTPVRGGGWSETQHPLHSKKAPAMRSMPQIESVSEISSIGDDTCVSTPIWGDHMRRLSTSSLGNKGVPLPDLSVAQK